MLENVSLELWEDFRFALRWKCIPLSLKWFIETAALWKEEGKKKRLCFCHVVRLCAAEQGADFVTLKYTRKVLWWAAGGKKRKSGGVDGVGGGFETVTALQHLRKHHSGLE